MRRANGDQHGVLERREIAPFAKFQLLLKVTGEVVMSRKLDRRAKRRVGLDENFAYRFAAAGPAGHLRQQLESSFAGAEIGHMQSEIRIDDSNQSYIREMQTLGDHLRSNEDVDLAGPETS